MILDVAVKMNQIPVEIVHYLDGTSLLCQQNRETACEWFAITAMLGKQGQYFFQKAAFAARPT